MQGLGRDTDDADAQAGVGEGLVEVAALVRGHAAVVARFVVEHEVGCGDGAADDGGAIEEAGAEGAGGRGVGDLATGGGEGLVGASEEGLEGMAGLGEGGGAGGKGVGGAVECSGG